MGTKAFCKFLSPKTIMNLSPQIKSKVLGAFPQVKIDWHLF
jgi:hypothetical protein